MCIIDFFVCSGDRFESLDSYGFTAYLLNYFNKKESKGSILNTALKRSLNFNSCYYEKWMIFEIYNWAASKGVA